MLAPTPFAFDQIHFGIPHHLVVDVGGRGWAVEVCGRVAFVCNHSERLEIDTN